MVPCPDINLRCPSGLFKRSQTMNNKPSVGAAPMVLFTFITIFPILLFVIFEKFQAPLIGGIGTF